MYVLNFSEDDEIEGGSEQQAETGAGPEHMGAPMIQDPATERGSDSD